jgi:hypothetical protein
MPRQTSIQLTEATERQVEVLKKFGHGSLTEIIRTAIDRMYYSSGWATVDNHSVIVHDGQIYGNVGRLESLKGETGISINGAEYAPLAGYKIVAGPALKGQLPEIEFRLTDMLTLPSDVPGTDGFYYQVQPCD